MSVEPIFRTVAEVAPRVRKGLPGRRVYGGAENPSGDQQLAADVYADELFEEHLLAHETVGSYASEEREDIVMADDGGDYHLAVDPLDGSSNLKPNNTMGCVVGVYSKPLPAPGRSLVAGGFVLFGPITTMTVAREGSVTEYVVHDDGTREAVVEDLTLPEDPTVYGFGGRAPDWPDDFRTFVEYVEEQRLKLRYGGAMIADVNQVLTHGGVFAYPGLVDRPEGKLRLQFEGNPIGYIIETAGGASSDGVRSLLDVKPERLHQRVPVHVGNEALIERLEAELN